MKTINLFLSLVFLITACTPSGNSSESVMPNNTHKDETWKGFWTLLQQAIEADDKTSIKQLCSFEHGINEVNFEETYAMFFSPAMRDLILTSPSESIRMENTSTSESILHSRVCSLYEEGEDEMGNTYESALMFYMGKVKSTGKYRIYLFMAAG